MSDGKTDLCKAFDFDDSNSWWFYTWQTWKQIKQQIKDALPLVQSKISKMSLFLPKLLKMTRSNIYCWQERELLVQNNWPSTTKKNMRATGSSWQVIEVDLAAVI